VLVITGASGHLGRSVTQHVLDVVDDPQQVVLATRTPDALAAQGSGAQVRFADFNRPEGLGEAFAGANRLLLISTDNVADRAAQHAAAIDAARGTGVDHVIYTSMISPGPDNPALISESHWATESHLRASGLAWTILRCGLYADFQVFEAAAALASGRLVHNRGAGGCAYLAREDCARAAAAVLAGEGGSGVVHDLTGLESPTAPELAALYSSVAGHDVESVAVSDDELLHELGGGTDGPAQYGAALAVSLGQATRGGHFERRTDTVQELTGRAPLRVRDLLERSRDTLEQIVPGNAPTS